MHCTESVDQDKVVNTLCNVQLNADTGEAELNCKIGVVQLLRKKIRIPNYNGTQLLV